MKTKSYFICALYVLTTLCIMAQSPYDHDRYVSPITGANATQVGLIGLAGPNGEEVGISIRYSQPTSETKSGLMGLGWSLPSFSILRSVNNFPDDYLEEKVLKKEYKNKTGPEIFSPSNSTNFFIVTGSFNYKELPSTFNPNHFSCDLTANSVGSSGNMFEQPAFDNYMIDAGLMNGVMELMLDWQSNSVGDGVWLYSEMQEIENKKWRSFRNAEPFKFDTKIAGRKFYLKGDYRRNTYIEVFTNNQILAMTGGFFHDMAESPRPADESIGAFRITDENGLVYHFTLPVYVYEDELTSFSVVNKISNSFPSFVNNFLEVNGEFERELSSPPATTHYSQYVREKAYAYEWKLVAITGPDYIDVNQNGKVDDLDKGFWIVFDHKPLYKDGITDSESFKFQDPAAGYSVSRASKDLDKLSRGERGAMLNRGDHLFDYNNLAQFTKGDREVYLINMIKTKTEELHFLYEPKLDEVGEKRNSDSKYQLNVALKSILRTPSGYHERFNEGPGTLPQAQYLPNNANTIRYYNAFDPEVDDFYLDWVLFDQDYFLRPGSPDNLNAIQNEFMLDIYGGHSTVRIRDLTSSSSQSGALTLKKIQWFKKGHYKKGTDVTPARIKRFEYGNVHSESITCNPAYSLINQDYYGFPKNVGNFRGSRFSDGSTDNIYAWLLSDIIEDEKLQKKIHYKEKKFSKLLSIDGGVTPPERVYAIKIVQNEPDYSNIISQATLNHPLSAHGHSKCNIKLIDPTADNEIIGLLSAGEFTRFDIYVGYSGWISETVPTGGENDNTNLGYNTLSYKHHYTAAILKDDEFTETFRTNTFDYTLFPSTSIIEFENLRSFKNFENISSPEKPTYIAVRFVLAEDMAGGAVVDKIQSIDINSTLSYETKYQYNGGVLAGQPHDVEFSSGKVGVRPSVGLFRLPTGVYYNTVRSIPIGLDNSQKGFKEYKFLTQDRFYSMLASNNAQDACAHYINKMFLDMPLYQLRDTVYKEAPRGKFYESIPDVVKSHIKLTHTKYFPISPERKLRNYLVPSLTSTNQYFTHTLGVGPEMASFGFPQPPCEAANALNDESFLSSGGVSGLHPVFTDNSLMKTAIFSARLGDNSSKFGLPLSEVTYDAKGDMVQSKIFKYKKIDNKNLRYSKWLLLYEDKNQNPNLTNYKFQYLHNIVLWSADETHYIENDLLTIEKVIERDATTNKPIKTEIIDASSGTIIQELEPSSIAHATLGPKSTQGIFSVFYLNLLNTPYRTHTKFSGIGELNSLISSSTLAEMEYKTTQGTLHRHYQFNVRHPSSTTSIGWISDLSPFVPFAKTKVTEWIKGIKSHEEENLLYDFHWLTPVLTRNSSGDTYSYSIFSSKTAKPIALFQNAKPFAQTFTSFENPYAAHLTPAGTNYEYFPGEIFVDKNYFNNTLGGHTGTSCVQIPAGLSAKVFKTVFEEHIDLGSAPLNAHYRGFVWVKSSGEGTDFGVRVLVTHDGVVHDFTFNVQDSECEIIGVGGWKKIPFHFYVPLSETPNPQDELFSISFFNNSGASVYFDDLMFCLSYTTFEGYVYDQYGYPVWSLDNEGNTIKLEYDHKGRNTKVIIEDCESGYTAKETEYID